MLIIGSSLLVAIAAGTVATWSFFQQSRRSIESTLAVTAQSKGQEFNLFLAALRRDVANFAQSPSAVRAMDSVGLSVKIMSPNARAALPALAASGKLASRMHVLGDFYGPAHDGLDPLLKSFAQYSDYGDAIFVDAAGTVAYSLGKHGDFGQPARSGTLQGSLLDEVVGRASRLPPGASVMTDLRFYPPVNAIVTMIGAPVYTMVDGQREMIGVLVVEVAQGRIDGILAPDPGSGIELSVLVGADGRPRSSVPLGGSGETLRTTFDAAMASIGHFAPKVDRTVLDQQVILAAVPLNDTVLGWTVIAAENTDALFRPVNRMVKRVVGISLLVTLLLAWAAAAVAARIARPVLALVERFEATLTNMPHGVVMVDAQRRLILCNAAYQAMYDLPAALSRPGTLLDDIDTVRQDQGIETLEPVIAQAAGEQQRELSDGRTVDVTRTPLPSGGYVATHQNITAAVKAQKQITYLATHDPLTGLPNRSSLEIQMEKGLEVVEKGEQLAVLCLDLDRFKAVNDTLGHPTGDLLLRAVAARMLDCLGQRDVLARLGGDEFVILQLDLASPQDAQDLAERLIERIASPFDVNGHDILIGLSVGVAMAPRDGLDGPSLIKNADLALYQAKGDGRGACRFFEATMSTQSCTRRQLELDLRHALADGAFHLAYQPIFALDGDHVASVEALIRWHHPERGAVPPADFISLAEERGLVVPIGEWVLRTACLEAASWPAHIAVAVNLSSIQVKSPTLLATVRDALHCSGLPPTRLELEITETVLLDENETTLATLHALKQMGIRIAMDDFGTGYSSLSYLRKFPFDKIKIDQSFVRAFDGRSDVAAIIHAIAQLGASLGMTITAEGVETPEQLRMVRQQGCTEAQGYLLCRPTSAPDLERFFALPDLLPRKSG